MYGKEAFGSAALAGKTVLITGAGSGVGAATALRVAAAGGYGILTDVSGQDVTCDAVAAAGGTSDSYRLDVTDAEDWQRVTDAVIARHGRIDGLANVAGIISATDSLTTLSEGEWDRILAVDLKGPWLGMRTIVPHMVKQGDGRVINVASVCGLIGMPNVTAYSAAKAGIIGLSRQIAVEYAGTGVRVNVLAPGMINTPMLGNATEQSLAGARAATPAGRIGEPDDMAAMIVFLLGSGSDYATGQTFIVDGGWVAQ